MQTLYDKSGRPYILDDDGDRIYGKIIKGDKVAGIDKTENMPGLFDVTQKIIQTAHFRVDSETYTMIENFIWYMEHMREEDYYIESFDTIAIRSLNEYLDRNGLDKLPGLLEKYQYVSFYRGS